MSEEKHEGSDSPQPMPLQPASLPSAPSQPAPLQPLKPLQSLGLLDGVSLEDSEVCGPDGC